MSRKSRSKAGLSKAVTVLFKKGRKGKVWAKTYKDMYSADFAITGIERKTSSKAISRPKQAKGFKFGAVVKRLNKNR